MQKSFMQKLSQISSDEPRARIGSPGLTKVCTEARRAHARAAAADRKQVILCAAASIVMLCTGHCPALTCSNVGGAVFSL